MLLELIRREARLPRGRILFMATVAALSNALILVIINAAAQGDDEGGGGHFRYLLLFVLIIAVFVVAQRYLMVAATSEMEEIVHKLRVRMAEKIRGSDLLRLERIGRSEIYASISKNTLAISQATESLVVALQSSLLILFTVAYIWWLSHLAFWICAAFTALALSIHFRKVRENSRDLHEAMKRENRLFEAITDILNGFKEARLNRRRSEELHEHYDEISISARDLKIHTHGRIADHFVFSQTVFFLLLAMMVFVVPALSGSYRDEVVIQGMAAVLFLIGPISTLIAAVPVFSQANAAADSIYALEGALDEAAAGEAPAEAPMGAFQEIRVEGVSFSYPDGGSAFSVGPLDLTVRAGEVLFIAGGNGTGKSTFLKLLTALYAPQQGRLRADGRLLDRGNQADYRQLFSGVFSDYHLFKRLYGLDPDPGEVEALLAELGIAGKTRVEEREFTTLDLSGGQRKRLALLVSLLEHRPVLVFDELAADQDPGFRHRFYTEILPELKARGKTVIAVTHDDRYFDAADRLVRMEDGLFIEDSVGAAPVEGGQGETPG